MFAKDDSTHAGLVDNERSSSFGASAPVLSGRHRAWSSLTINSCSFSAPSKELAVVTDRGVLITEASESSVRLVEADVVSLDMDDRRKCTSRPSKVRSLAVFHASLLPAGCDIFVKEENRNVLRNARSSVAHQMFAVRDKVQSAGDKKVEIEFTRQTPDSRTGITGNVDNVSEGPDRRYSVR